MTKPRGPLPELTAAQQERMLSTSQQTIEAIMRERRALLCELRDAGWSLRMLAQLYGVTHSVIRYWMRVPPRATDPGYPRGEGEG